MTTRHIDSDDQYFVVTVKNKLYADYLNTQLWYLKYQCLVLGIPKSGTWNTNIWYLEYQRLVLNIPKGGIQMVLAAYCFTTCYKNNISLKKKDSPTSNILYDMQKNRWCISKYTPPAYIKATLYIKNRMYCSIIIHR